MTEEEAEVLLKSVALPDAPTGLEQKIRAAAARRAAPRIARAWAPPALAASLLVFATIVWLTLSREPDAPVDTRRQDGAQLLREIDRTWGDLVEQLRDRETWVDKRDFSMAYEEWKKPVARDDGALAAVEKTLLAWFESRKTEEGLAWRLHALLADIAADRKDPALATKRLDEAIGAYPDRRYTDPSKHSKFQHLVNARAMLVWDAKGAEAALDYATTLLAEDRRFRYFFAHPWLNRVEDEPAFTAKVREAYETRGKKFPEFAAEARRFAGELAAQDDEADLPSQDLKAAGDEKKRYFLIGPKKGAKAPAGGYALVLIMPGGDGSAEFHPFVKRIVGRALPDGHIAAQPVAVDWTGGDPNRVVWPTEKDRDPKIKFTTEEFVETVIEDVAKKQRIDRKRVFTLSWSSSGPAAYAISLHRKNLVAGSFVAMSVFRTAWLPPLSAAKGHAYYLYQSPDDRICPLSHAEEAKRKLGANGAAVELKTYAGGHGWHGDTFGAIRDGFAWLQKNAARR